MTNKYLNSQVLMEINVKILAAIPYFTQFKLFLLTHISMNRWIIFLLATFVPTFLMAQVSGTLSGYVINSTSEEPLVGATVRLDSTRLGATTNEEGFFSIANIPTKAYNVTATYLGFKPLTKFNVIVRSQGNIDLNFQLEETAIEVEGVEIRPDPFIKSIETPLSTQSLTTEEIIAYPGGSNDVAKVIQSLPGVSGAVQGFRNEVIIRGGAPNEVVYYLDGIEIPNINHFATQGSGGGPVSLLNVSFFEGVTLTTSAFSAQYDNTLSAVLQFDQRNGNNRELRTNVRVSASDAALTLEGPIGGKGNESAKTSYIVSVRRSYLQLLFQLLELPFLPDYWDYQFKINHKIDPYNEINLIGLGAIDDFSTNIPDDLTPEAQTDLDQAPIISQWSSTTGISWRMRFKEKVGFLRNSLSYNILNNNFQQFEDNENEEGLFFANDSRDFEIKFRSEYTQFFGDLKLSAGATVQRVAYQNETDDLINEVNFNSDIDFYKYGFFSQVSRPLLNNRIRLSVGFRLDGNSFTDNGNDLFRTFSPRLAVSTQLDELGKWKLNASVGRYYKIPPSTVLGFKDNTQTLVNRNAKYIRSDHFVAGFEFSPRVSTRFTVEGFYKRYGNYPVSIRDSVSLANLGADFEVFGSEPVESVGLGRTFGIEFLAQQKLTRNLFAILAYTLYQSEYTNFDEEEFVPSIWDNRQIVSFTGGYKFGKNWELGAKFRYLGRAPFAPVDQEATTITYPEIVLDYSRLGEDRIDVFNALDVRIDKKWNFEKLSLNVFLDIQNLYGADVPQPPVYGLARDENREILLPRTLVEITDLETGTILPSIGIVVDF